MSIDETPPLRAGLPAPPPLGRRTTTAAEVGDHSTAGLNARAAIATHLADHHVPAPDADGLLAAVAAGGVASAQKAWLHDTGEKDGR